MLSFVRENCEQIPKIIHYCWYGGKEIPDALKKCMDTWSILKDYQVMRWDESNCSFEENEFVRKTWKERRLGFIGDYYRLKAVYLYGGIYLDTDVKINRDFGSLLENKAFFNFIFDCSIGSAIIGAVPHHPLIGALLDLYERTVMEDYRPGIPPLTGGEDGMIHANGYVTSNYYYTWYMIRQRPELILNNRRQIFDDFVINPKEDFEIGRLSGRHYAVHLCAGEWREKAKNSGSIYNRIKVGIDRWPWLFDHVQILVRKIRYRKLNRKIPFYPCARAQRRKLPLPEI